MPSRRNNSTLSGSSASRSGLPPIASGIINPGISRDEVENALVPENMPSDFKDNKAAQFEYGRQSQAKTQHFDTSTHRLRIGNPIIEKNDEELPDPEVEY